MSQADKARPVHQIDNDAAFEPWVARLREAPIIAIDTESNSMHAYFERVCLVQITIPEADLLVDPLTVNMAPLGTLLEDGSIEKVFHGADYDVLSLKRAYGFSIAKLFDTMIAARVLGWPHYGLAAILADIFSYKTNKAFQRHDWAERPIAAKALEYARYDTHFLLELRDAQWAQLVERGRVQHFEHACRRQERVEPRTKVFDPDTFWKIKGSKDLDGAGQAVLKALFVWRDQKSRELDRPPFRVMPDLAMLGMARARPQTTAALVDIKGLPRPALRRDGARLLELVATAAAGETPQPKKDDAKPKLARAVSQRFDALRAWRKAHSEQLGVEPDIVLGKACLMELAELHPDNEAALLDDGLLDAWECEQYAAGVLKALKR